MSSSEDATPVQSPPLSVSEAPLDASRLKNVAQDVISNISTASLPGTAILPSVASARSSILPERTARSLSPTGRTSLINGRLERSSTSSTLLSQIDGADDTRTLIIRAFSPTVAVFCSPDTDELAQRKGFKHGFTELIRPFGEVISGKVVIRDSVGASRAWDDFGVKFADLGQIVEDAYRSRERPPNALFGALEEDLEEKLLDTIRHDEDFFGNSLPKRDTAPASPLYQLFLRRLISGSYVSPHETFAHPVTCVIAISSQNQSPIESLRQLYEQTNKGNRVLPPIESLRQLYEQTNKGNRVLPPWANPEYLRYYVLVHDEDRDDLAKSSALFDQMKRHFGLHCHLLRLRGVQASPGADDAIPAMDTEWISPIEDITSLRKTDNPGEMEESEKALFESDAAAITTFVRELVTQSVVPHMESRISLWNDQIASKRRGFTGRFISVSKRWAGFGSSRNSSSPTSGGIGGSGASYDALQGYYRAETPEALLRKLADYCFMLRDYKLAASTYEMLRSDYNNDKAWKHLAGANEMCAISNLLNPMALAAKVKIENIDQMLETATYSYLTRCSDPHNSLRCIALAVELLRIRSKSGAEASAKWSIRILELGLVGPIGHVLISERIAACFIAHLGSGIGGWGTRKRKAAFWYVMAAEEWLKLGQVASAASSLEQADWLYRNARPSVPSKLPSDNHDAATTTSSGSSALPFAEMQAFLEQLQLAVKMKKAAAATAINTLTAAENADGTVAFDEDEEGRNNGDLLLQPPPMAEEQDVLSEKLDVRSHRRSLIAPVMNNTYDIGPISPTRIPRSDMLQHQGTAKDDDDFE